MTDVKQDYQREFDGFQTVKPVLSLSTAQWTEKNEDTAAIDDHSLYTSLVPFS